MERDDRDTAKSVRGDVHDTVDELKHRAEAGAEKLKRGIEGDRMSPGERLGSHVKEAGHDVAADLHKANRTTRDEEGI